VPTVSRPPHARFHPVLGVDPRVSAAGGSPDGHDRTFRGSPHAFGVTARIRLRRPPSSIEGMSTIDRVRVKGWVLRYLPLEVLGTIAALVAAWAAYEASGSLAIAAIAGSLGESVGYYALVIVRSARGHAASARVRLLPGVARRAWATTWLTARSVAAEFGPAELVDTILVRPALLWAASAIWGAAPVAWLVGKLAADVVFYTVAIASFEAGRRIILPDGGRSSEASAAALLSEPQREGALR